MRKAKAVKRKTIEKTDGSTGSNCGRGGDESGNDSSGEESFENYDNNDKDNDNTSYDPSIDKENIQTSVVIYSSLKNACSEDKSNKTEGQRDTSSKKKECSF